MRWLKRVRRSMRPDRGAAAIIVTVLVSCGVVIGMLAITADLGSVASQRRSVQNSSDAAVMSLAVACAKKDATICSTANATTALASLAGANSTGATVDSACASTVAQASPLLVPISTTCAAGVTSDLGACLPASTATALLPYVEVRTSNSASTPFGGAIGAGASRPVPACARAAWGSPGDYTAQVPIVVSECEWKNNTSDGTVYQTGPAGPAPGYGTAAGQTPWPAASSEITIYLKSTTTVPCAINGKDTAGGFGYVDDSTGNCAAVVSINGWASIDTGSSPPPNCYAAIAALQGKVVELPIFDCLVKQLTQPTGPISGYPDCTGAGAGGAKSWYHVVGWAKFYLSGYKVGGSQEAASLRSGVVPCSGGDRCLSGWYVTGTLTGSGTIVPPTPGNSFGAVLVAPAG